LFVSNDTSLNGNLGVSKNIIDRGTLTVDGITYLNSNLFVSQDASLNSRLFVSNDTSLNGNLGVSKNIIDINLASEEELRKHPYLQWKLAKQLIKFREAHGSFEEVKDLEEIWGLDRDKLKKLIPYLVFNIDSSRKK
ncbi:MAG: helix-hairpin-helix domain-containing protein, partial [Chitinophagaceae bacterium]|nr:helix-hairpin-helix domain-containing protein [Chitinophagaceae bacterium]